MAEYIVPAVMMTAAFLAAWGVILGAVGGLTLTRRLPDGLMHHFFYALLLSNGVAMALSTRDFSAVSALMEPHGGGNPIAAWAIRLTSLLVMVASADQILRRFLRKEPVGGLRVLTIAALIAFWVGNILLPAFLSAHRAPLQLNWIYTPILCMGLICLSPDAAGLCIRYCRNAIIAFCGISLLLIVARPSLVLDSNYLQGFLPGVPRFAGLAPHAVVMGLTACLGIWTLLYRPLAARSGQWSALGICLLALFLSQAKGAWLTFLLSLPVLLACRHELPSFTRVSQSRYRDLVIAVALLAAALAVLGATYLALGKWGDKLSHFLSSEQGAQILSMTGRDRIWEVALGEWQKSPLFGYGLALFGPAHQIQIGMLYATHGHNQFIDALGRTGLVGTLALTFYVAVLAMLSIRCARASRGLSAVLMLALAVRMVSEVPLALSNISPEALTHYLLLATIASCIAAKKPRQGAAA
jgi:O-antigen ligase